MTSVQEEIWCESSDNEKYNPCKAKKGTLEPIPEDILKIFEELKVKKVLKLSWSCPGRCPPNSEEHKLEVVDQPAVPNEFDFDDDNIPDTRTMLTPRWTPGSAPKSQKKVVRIYKVLKDVMYQRKIQAAEKEAQKLAGAKSPRTNSTGRTPVGSPAGLPRIPAVSHINRQSPSRFSASGDPFQNNTVRTPYEQNSLTRVTKSENGINNVNVSSSRQEPSITFTPSNVSTSVTQKTESTRNQISLVMESSRSQNNLVTKTSRSVLMSGTPRNQNTNVACCASETSKEVSLIASNPVGNYETVISRATNGNTVPPVTMLTTEAAQFVNEHRDTFIDKMDTS